MKFEPYRIALYIAEAIAFVSAMYSFKKYKKNLNLLIYFGFIVLAEYIGRYFVGNKQFNYSKYWFAFIVIPLEFFFWYWFFLNHFKVKKERAIVKTGIMVLAVSFIVEWLFFYDTKAIFISLSYTLGNLILLLFILLYFKNLIHSKRILTFDKEVEFWICCGLLLFYLGTFPMFGLYNYFLANYPQELKTYYVVMLILNSLMYLLFSFGMLWTKPK